MERQMEPLNGAGDLKIAVILNPDLPVGLIANTAAVVSTGLGAASPGVAGVELTDHTGFCYSTSADRPVPILQATRDALQSLRLKAAETRPDNGYLVVFPAFARKLHSFQDYMAAVPQSDLATEDLDGIGLLGPSKWIKSLTGSMKLLR
jgi:hypothetical protein